MNDNSANEIRSLKMQVAKLQLESKLRRNLASELDKQKQIAKAAQEASNQKSKEIEEIASQLSKYLSPQLYDSIFLGNKTAKIQSDKKYLTVFFSDIISFTKISDNMESAPLTEMLNSYLTSMTDIAISFGGTIDKYIGDSIMIFFGDPVTEGKKSDAIRCVEMSIEMQKSMRKLSQDFQIKFNLITPLQIRIGIHSGECTVGNFGSESRLDYTVIGSTVNLASRLEAASLPGEVLISKSTYSLISKDIICSYYDNISAKGFDKQIETYQVNI
jgi:class 3 adenylate cyclase|tara:strand:+ start:80 stop:898 length:819 start_codon:yes stop_codon:yes gene_type:complete